MEYTIQTHRELNLIISIGCIFTMSIIGFSVMDLIKDSKWIELSVAISLIVLFYLIFRKTFNISTTKEICDKQIFDCKEKVSLNE